MKTQFQLSSYIYAYTNEAHSLANLQDLIPTLTGTIIGSIKYNTHLCGLNLASMNEAI